ncbi:hypothetical protein NDU88_003096 [Pleurodeles waltl]|uniref:Uncharacterized protein n=1 Tax=Pleurodeles waltl TaxID=8319 RepID=A0AAV7SG25_PLEWA|nr:hypothetical protein NDU88_003096 [Pleurodeles waltl]
MGRKRGDPKMPGENHPEQNPGEADQREDRKDGKRPRRSRIGRRLEFLGEKQSRADTFTVPTLGRRPLALGQWREKKEEDEISAQTREDIYNQLPQTYPTGKLTL